MEFVSRRIADVIIATPTGRIDHAAAGAFEQAMLPLVAEGSEAYAGVVVDFAAVDYVSSFGLRVLLVIAKQVRARGARFAICGMQPVVAHIFAISRFDAILDLHPSLPSALQSVSPAAAATFDAMPPRDNG